MTTISKTVNNNQIYGSINKWLVFSLMSDEFVAQIRWFVKYGQNGQHVIVVAKRDDVFYVPCNDVHKTIKLEQLCQKQVVKITAGNDHVCALTAANNLYVWGKNNYNQLGTGDTISLDSPVLLDMNLINDKVVDVMCGFNHTLALTDLGKVYIWGYKVVNGQSNQIVPVRVNMDFNVISIACGGNFSVALTNTGHLFHWGFIYQNEETYSNPLPIKLNDTNDVNVKKVVCGVNHAIALSCDGTVYTFGNNNLGQLGYINITSNVYTSGSSRRRFNQDIACTVGHKLHKLDNKLGPFVDIAASLFGNMSVAVTVNYKYYIWGQCRDQVNYIFTPMETKADSLHDLFAIYSTPTVTYCPVVVNESEFSLVVNDLYQAFNDPYTSNLKITIDGKDIYVHKEILVIRCKHFKDMFGNNWKESKQKEMKITQYSYEAYEVFLRYLYTGRVCVAPETGLELLDLAQSYCESDLKRKCVRLIREKITVDNVADIYSAAIKYMDTELENLCFTYALAHITDVLLTKSFDNLEPRIYKDFMIKACKIGAFKN